MRLHQFCENTNVLSKTSIPMAMDSPSASFLLSRHIQQLDKLTVAKRPSV